MSTATGLCLDHANLFWIQKDYCENNVLRSFKYLKKWGPLFFANMDLQAFSLLLASQKNNSLMPGEWGSLVCYAGNTDMKIMFFYRIFHDLESIICFLQVPLYIR